MTETAISTFDAHAGDYEALRRQLIPCFDEFYGTAIAALELAARPLRSVLDLGSGTGLLARSIRQTHRDCALTLLDGSTAMLERARMALGGDATYVCGDLNDALPAGRWDAVVSALAIHHLEDRAKRELFARIHAALAPGGVFVNAEQVRGPTPLLENAYKRWHQRRALELGAGELEWENACERMRFDQLCTVHDQLAWLRTAGFADADCVFKDHCFAVLVAPKPSTAREPSG